MKHPFGNPYYLFNIGENEQAYQCLGAHPEPDSGVRFAVWAPHAQAVYVIGDFNAWSYGHALQPIGETGIWSLTVASARIGQKYKYAIQGPDGRWVHKADPFAQASELRPHTASVICGPSSFEWTDEAYLARRPLARANNYPINIYEVHAGSWMKHPDGRFYDYRTLAHRLGDYLVEMGYNYVELMPLLEHPLDASWGYQVTGFFAPTARYGSPDDLRYFVNHLHELGIGVILDWVPAHFPKDEAGLYQFDGTPTFESADPRLAQQAQWGTMVFDYAKAEVRSFLYSSAVYWLESFHFDGLRYDAVSTILYHNYGEETYVSNRYGGRENLEGVEFLKSLNQRLATRFPQALLIAEESTTWEGLTKPVEEGGLGFTLKWDMGWMHDTLDYLSLDYVYRPYHHHELTFSMSYGFSERFVLPLSHDEVVHGKHSLIGRMPGDYWRQFASLRTLFAYMIGHPGGKHLFMGGEFGQFIEWRFYEELEWFLLAYDQHRQLQAWVKTLNHFYLDHPACWQVDTNWEGFRWIQANDRENSVYAFYRRDEAGHTMVFLLNLTPAVHPVYTVGVPAMGRYVVRLNSDAVQWGGSGYPIEGFALPSEALADHASGDERIHPQSDCVFQADEAPSGECPYSITLTLPPLSALVLEWLGPPSAEQQGEVERRPADPRRRAPEAAETNRPSFDSTRQSAHALRNPQFSQSSQNKQSPSRSASAPASATDPAPAPDPADSE